MAVPRRPSDDTAAPVLPDAAALDRDLQELAAHADEWARLGVPAKIQMLRETRARLASGAQRWVDASARAKGIDPRSPWVGEEWVSGPWALAEGINGSLATLRAIAGGSRPHFEGVFTREDGRVVVPVYPRTLFDRLLLSGVHAEVWMQPGLTEQGLADSMAGFYRLEDPKGRVALVLGAGNINAIAPLDVLHRLVASGQVVLLKMNPVNAYLAPILEEVFASFVGAGFLRVVSGGADVGAYLTGHDGIDEIHVTGSRRTHDAIVWGPGEEGEARRASGTPLLSRPITSELGGISPTIVVPGPWSRADLRFQAENVLTTKLHNAGCNCVATQVLVLPSRWELRDAFLDELRRLMQELPPRGDYYPGAAERRRMIVAAHPNAEQIGGPPPRILVTGIDPEAADEVCFTTEAFTAALAETSLPGDDPGEFLSTAVEFCNRRLDGTLGAGLIVHPRTARELGPGLQAAIGALRYGAIGVNVWSGAAFLLAQASWGAYPGHTLADVGSGIGKVHNSFLFDRSEKTVVWSSFYPFPRSWMHGDPSLLPKPPWFVTNRTAAVTTRRVAQFACDPGWRHLPGIFASALRG